MASGMTACRLLQRRRLGNDHQVSGSLRFWPSIAAAVVVATPAAVVLIAELVQWRAARHGRGGGMARPVVGRQVVLVLGSPSRPRGGLHPMQRWRTDIAVRSMHPVYGRLLFSGASPAHAPGEPSEAWVMADYAQEVLGVPVERIAVEEAARSTWQNVAHCLPELERAESITIASTPTHAARARRYLVLQRPYLQGRLVPAADYRFGEHCGWKVITLAYALVRTARRILPKSTPGCSSVG